MIRLIQRRLIIPRGDTGTFTVPVLATKNTGDVAVFSIIDTMTDKKVFEKIVNVSGDTMTIEFSHYDTVNLPVGKYVWDIKFYQNPEFMDGVLVNGVEVDSYYAAFTMPICEIRQTGDNLLMADDAPGTELTPDQLDILNAAVNETNAAKNQANESAASANTAATTAADKADEATAKAEEATAKAEEATAALNELKEILPSLAEVATSGSYEDLEDKPFIPSRVSDLTDDSGHYTKPANGIPASDLEETYLTEHQDISGKANIADLAAVATSGDYSDLSGTPIIPDVQINGHSVINNGIANIPVASKSVLGTLKLSADSNIKTGTETVRVITPSNQHLAAFYGLAKAAGTDEKNSELPVGQYTDSAKTAIQTMLDVPSNAAMTTAISTAIGNINSFDMAVVQELPTQDISTHTIYLVPKTGETNDVYDEYVYINNAWEMVGNTQIDLSNYVQKTDYATSNTVGLVKVGNGLYNSSDGAIHINAAPERIIKLGTGSTAPIVSSNQHQSTFYGLAKAAGDSTQSQSSNAVGTYTDEAKAAIQQMLDVPSTSDIPDTSIYVTKESIDNAGITDRTYVTKYDGSITTALDGTYESPWCELPNVDGGFACMVYRVTFDNVIYELRAGLFDKYYNKAAKGVEFIGDLSMYIDPTGCLYEVYDVPFCIIDNVADYVDGLLVFSKTAGEHTLKLELELLNYNKLPPELIYGKSESPIMWKHNSSSSYFGVSVGSGSNILENTRNVIAVGGGNKISADNGHAYGVDNVISGLRSIAIGLRNNTTGQDNYAFGYNCSTSNEGSLAIGYQTQSSGGYGSIATGYVTTASGIFSHSEGSNSIASGSASHAENMLTTASGTNSHAEGWRTIANHRSQHVFGQANVVDPSTAAATALGTYAEIVGNGTADNARSNAYALTWTGDGHYAGDVYVHANADSTGGTKLATIEDIPEVPVQDVQVNGVSVLQGGVANVPLADDNTYGVARVRTDGVYGVRIYNGQLATKYAASGDIKNGSNGYKPIVPLVQNESTFYGLAKSAGDTTQSQSSNTVGNYTDAAKEAIQSMLGITQMLAPENPNLVATQAYSIGDVFAANGHLYKATAAIAQDAAIIPDTNCVETTMAEAGGKIKDVQVAGSSVVGNDGVANIPVATSTTPGMVRVNGYGLSLGTSGNIKDMIYISYAGEQAAKLGISYYNPIVPHFQDHSVFYGLSKAAGVDLANETVTLGTYPEASKTAIKQMLGVEEGLKVVRLI